MPVDRPAVGPLAVHFCARQAGVTIQDYSLDDELLADCVVRYYEKFRPDAVWLSSDTWITGEAMGCHVVCTEPDQPMGGRGEPMVRTPSDIDRIPDPSVTSQARMPLMIRAMERIKERLGDDVFLVACFDQQPFSLACECMGINEIMLKVIDDPPFVEAMLERCIDYAVAYAIGLEQAGADMLSSGDSPAGLLGPSRYREFALPAGFVGRAGGHGGKRRRCAGIRLPGRYRRGLPTGRAGYRLVGKRGSGGRSVARHPRPGGRDESGCPEGLQASRTQPVCAQQRMHPARGNAG
jgi:uroporphyrinogen-III decarboxylase